MKKRLLIVYSKMIIGGSTTSLLSLLNELDYQKYDVDLLLLEMGGVLDGLIPKEVNILDNGFLHLKRKPLFYKMAFLGAYCKSKIQKNSLIRSQIMSNKLAQCQPALDKTYDVAVAYLEFWPSQYVCRRVCAKRKILWLHCDYKGTRLDPKYDQKMYDSADAVVTVSEACKANFKALFPNAKSVVTVQNILSSKTIFKLSNAIDPNEALYEADLVFTTVARIDFISKGHDRGVAVFKKIKELYPNKSFRWIVIGDGPDRAKLEELIGEAGLETEIVLLGEKNNPHPYVKKADIFFLPSRYEGKPMSVTEGQMNGAVPFVTNYASAHGQVHHMVDGLVCENNNEAIFDMMEKIFSGEIDLTSLKHAVSKTEYSNLEEIKRIYALLECQ